MPGQKKPEHCRQSWIHHFLDKVILPPRDIRAIDHAGKDMGQFGTRMAALGRGLKPGTPDHLVIQGRPLVVVGIEVKHNTGASGTQTATADAWEACGAVVGRECRTTHDVLATLRRAGMRLHENADNLAVEYQVRMEVGLAELAGGVRKKGRSAPRQQKAPARTIARLHKAGWWRAPA